MSDPSAARRRERSAWATDPSKRSLLWKAIQTMLCRPAAKVALQLKTYNRENVPGHGGVLLVTNHESFYDPVLVAVELDRPMASLAREELFKNPAFGWLIRSLHAFPVGQGRGDVGAVKESIRLLQAGWLLNIFPEGQRTPDGELHPAQGGAALVIRKAKVPVVPCYIEGAFQAWPRHNKLPGTGRISVVYGQPMTLHDERPQDILTTIDEAFLALRDDLHALEEARR